MNRKITTQRWISPLLMAISFTVFSLLWFSQSYTQEANPIQIQTPLGWDNWLPKAFKSLLFKVDIDSDHANSSATFTLSEVTDWKGICMNYGAWASDNDKDLKFAISSEQASINGVTWEGGNQSLTARWIGSPPSSLPVKVLVHDYGAYGKLTAKLYGMSTTHTITIPKDNNGNMIADGWKDDSSRNHDASADDETGPAGNSHSGDGLSIFEEYRGFWVKGSHKQTDPINRKDLFIYSQLSVGYGMAGVLPRSTQNVIQLHLINENEMDDNRRIDFNVGGGLFHKGVPGGNDTKQKALKVIDNQRDTPTQQGKPLAGLTFDEPNF